MADTQISIIIPTLNEAGNIAALVRRLARVFQERALTGELVFIDDHSTDGTRQKITALAAKYQDTFALQCHVKQGQRGKAESLIEGFALAQYEVIVMIDADLQYPPEAIPGMLAKLEQGADIVVANRAEHETDWLRRMLSKTFHLVFSRLLHDLHCDSQSGLKVFRRKILRDVTLHATRWTFDMEFLLSARNYGYVIDTVGIAFAERQAGTSKLSPLQAVLEIGWSALMLKWQGQMPLIIHPENQAQSMIGAGVAHDRQRFVTHTTLHHHVSALSTFAPWQRNFIFTILALIALGLLLAPLATGIAIIAVLSTVYFVDTFFNLGLVLRSLQTPPEIESSREELDALDTEILPVYTVLCPLYKEAHMLHGFVTAISALEWPKERLDVLLLLEENDPETIAAARAMKLPAFIRIIVVPHSMPKTKPKACNYGLALARGEYVVIYDAEDVPEATQLKKAYLGFRKAGPRVKCLQAKLNYFNPHQNLLTRFFTAEYSLWFDIILVGLQSINTSIPLGGTSNHFRTSDLLELEGWDPFNVTEDCDLGVRIFKRGFRTAVIDSVTLEEANSRPWSWLKQRSRWIKGYMQTYLVHMRHPFQFVRENGIHSLVFQLVVGGKIAFLFINPILWVTTIAYFTLYIYVGPTIQLLYPMWVFYMAAISLVFGNFLYIYYYMIGCAKRQHWPLIKYVLFIPLYWVMGSTAAYIALYELIWKPHYWQKTSHGLHLLQNKESRFVMGLKLPALPAWLALAPVRQLGTRITGMVPAPLRNFIFSSKGFLMLGLVFSNFLNFVFNAFLGRALSFEALALVTLMNTLGYFVMIVIGAFSSTINHRTAYLVTAEGPAAAHHFFRQTLRNALVLTLVVSLLWVVAVPFFNRFFHVESAVALLFFTPVFSVSVLLAGYRGFLQGNLYFTVITSLLITESLLKLLLAALFVAASLSDVAYLAIPLSVLGTAAVALLLSRFHLPKTSVLPTARRSRFPFQFFSAALLTNLSAIVFLSVDIFLVNHYFEPVVAGQYALLSLVGKMIYFLGSLPNAFTLTFVSRNEGLRANSVQVLRIIYGATLLVVVSGVGLLGVLGARVVPFLFGSKALAIVPFLLPYTVALGLFTLASVTVSYHLAKKHYVFSVTNFVLALALVVGIILSHGSLGAIVRVVLGTSIFGWLILSLFHFAHPWFRFGRRALRDFVGVFYNGLPKNTPALAVGKKRILIFNWRDTKHKFAGGAEVYVHEIAKGWVKEGNQVTLFCGNDGREKRSEVIDGIQVVRRGGFYLVYVWAFLYYMFRFRGRYDVVIDCENGIPFFTPVYVRTPILCLLHHVHQEVFYYSLPRPLAWFASFLEKDVMTFFYKKVKFITVSESSKSEMETFGIGQAGIQVVNPGVTLSQYTSLLAEKTSHPMVLYLGRLKAYKSVNVLIQAFRLVLAERPETELVIAGDGEERASLVRLARELHLTGEQVRFIGRVSHDEKVRLLQSAWVFVNPSFREGWGIVNIEANASGTPVIASDVPGLRDSVRHNETGYLVEYGDTKAFAEKMLEVIRNRELREGLSRDARTWSERFSWEKASELFYNALH